MKKKTEVEKVVENGVSSPKEAELVWNEYTEHRTKAELLLRAWGEWAKKAYIDR